MTSRRNTIQKDLVRNTVYEMRRHVTANEVYEFIKEAYPTIQIMERMHEPSYRSRYHPYLR